MPLRPMLLVALVVVYLGVAPAEDRVESLDAIGEQVDLGEEVSRIPGNIVFAEANYLLSVTNKHHKPSAKLAKSSAKMFPKHPENWSAADMAQDPTLVESGSFTIRESVSFAREVVNAGVLKPKKALALFDEDLGEGLTKANCTKSTKRNLKKNLKELRAKAAKVKSKKAEAKKKEQISKTKKKIAKVKEVLKKKERIAKKKKVVAKKKKKKAVKKLTCQARQALALKTMKKQIATAAKEGKLSDKENGTRKTIEWRRDLYIKRKRAEEARHKKELKSKKAEKAAKKAAREKRLKSVRENRSKQALERKKKARAHEKLQKRHNEVRQKETKTKREHVERKAKLKVIAKQQKLFEANEAKVKRAKTAAVARDKERALKNQYQPMKNRNGKGCLAPKGTGLVVGSCAHKWFYNRITRTIRTRGNKCVTRAGDNVSLKPCHKSSANPKQKWVRRCGALVNGKDKGILSVKPGKSQILIEKWYGEKGQLWHYKAKVMHNKCGNKRYKVMNFDGTLQTTVRQANLLSMPTKQLTIAVWIKGQQGTPYSYASKKHVDAFAITNPRFLTVYVMDQKILTRQEVGGTNGEPQWTHVAVSWDSATGSLKVYKNGSLIFHKMGVQKGKSITPGGCMMLGQRAKKACKERIPGESFKGQLTDFVVWRGVLSKARIGQLIVNPVSKTVMQKVGKLTGPKPPKDLRIAWLTRQYATQELGKAFPPTCKLKKNKRLSGPKGWMKWGGSGDVHYHTFGHCYYDDQTIGEWVAAKVVPKYWKEYPLMIQFRTSPNAQRCSWCQNGAVAFIDGCAVSYKGEQASAGFGGFNFPNSNYAAYASFNMKSMPSGKWMRGKNLRAKAKLTASRSYGQAHGNFQAVLSDGTSVMCAKGSIAISIPKMLIGKVEGLAGNGKSGKEYIAGPNTKASGGIKAGSMIPGLTGCKHHAQYPKPKSPFNGNSPTKPIVKWFKSWQVDGVTIPSAFGYGPGRGAGSFNRVAGQKLKPVSKVSKGRPKGAKEKAFKACKPLRNSPKARTKCIFDFMVLGASAIKKTVRDRMEQRKVAKKKPSLKTVRDVSKWRNDAEWTASPSWGCVDPFNKVKKWGGKPRPCTKGETCAKVKHQRRITANRNRMLKHMTEKTNKEIANKKKKHDAMHATHHKNNLWEYKAHQAMVLEKDMKYAAQEQERERASKAQHHEQKMKAWKANEARQKAKFSAKTDTIEMNMELVDKETLARMRYLQKKRKQAEEEYRVSVGDLECDLDGPFDASYAIKSSKMRWSALYQKKASGICDVEGAQTVMVCDAGGQDFCLRDGSLKRFSCGCKRPFHFVWLKRLKAKVHSSISHLPCGTPFSGLFAKSSAHNGLAYEASRWFNVCKQKKMEFAKKTNKKGMCKARLKVTLGPIALRKDKRFVLAVSSTKGGLVTLVARAKEEELGEGKSSKNSKLQNWRMDNDGQIRLTANPKLCLSVSGKANSNNSPLRTRPCTGAGYQMWVSDTKKGLIKLMTKPNMCISLHGNRRVSGTAVAIETKCGRQSTMWHMSTKKPQTMKRTYKRKPSNTAQRVFIERKLTEKMKRHVKGMGEMFLHKPKAWYPKNSCGSVFVSSTSVCKKGPIVNAKCLVGGKRVMIKAGCGCKGQLARGEMTGVLTDFGKDPYCTNQFTKRAVEAKRTLAANFETTNCAQLIFKACKKRSFKIESIEREKMMQKRAESLEAEQMKVVSFKKTMHKFNAQTNRAFDTVAKLQQKLEGRNDWDKFFEFTKIPYMKMMGTQLPGETALPVCQRYCANHGDCKSISYDKAKGICTWSTLSFTFDPNFNAYIKRHHRKNQAHRFDVIPGMMYQEPSTTTRKSRSFNECKLDCFLNEGCHMFSHSSTPSPGTCILGAESISYNDDFDYYEKGAIPQFPSGEKAQVNLLNGQKKELVKQVHAANIKIKAADKAAAQHSKAWHLQEYKRRIYQESSGPAPPFGFDLAKRTPCSAGYELGEDGGCVQSTPQA